jgi:hypothetical protein
LFQLDDNDRKRADFVSVLEASVHKLILGLVFILCAAMSGAQRMPQWKVVQVVTMTHQTAAIPPTTILTPTHKGLYRLTGYMTSVMNTNQYGYWTFNFSCTDLSPQGSCNASMGVATGSGFSSYIPSYIFCPLPGTPVNYELDASDPPPLDSQYDFTFTIEELQ